MFAIITGLIGGILHVISGPDHLAAIAPLAAEKTKSAWSLGFKWGMGHSGGIFIIGLLFLLAKPIIPLDTISMYSERLVGLILILIGLWGFRRLFLKRLPLKIHSHHYKMHPHSLKEVNSFSALLIGIIHGLAGSSHFLGVLPALAMPSRTASILYLSAFAAGTISAMTVFSSAIGILSGKLSYKFHEKILAGFSLSAMMIGCVWLMI